MKIAIDLLWVRVGKCGGTESSVRNLLFALTKFDKKNEYLLFCARDNEKSFRHYHENNERMHIVKCPVDSMNRVKRIAWENLYFDDTAAKVGADIVYVPVYSMPRRKEKNKIPYITTIHDLQGWHYPEYFSKIRLSFLKRSWKYSVSASRRVVAISQYTKSDIEKHYPDAKGKVVVIPNTVIYNPSELPITDLEIFGVKKNEYFYCVSSLLPHKNLDVILETLSLRKKQGSKHGEMLVISGVGGSGEQKNQLEEKINALDIKDEVIVTGFVSDGERNLLYENCRLFLFPSIYEGFGMPPVEALMAGKSVVTTDATSIPEVTGGLAYYVSDTHNPAAWSGEIDRVLADLNEDFEMPSSGSTRVTEEFKKYSEENVARAYIDLFNTIIQENGK